MGRPGSPPGTPKQQQQQQTMAVPAQAPFGSPFSAEQQGAFSAAVPVPTGAPRTVEAVEPAGPASTSTASCSLPPVGLSVRTGGASHQHTTSADSGLLGRAPSLSARQAPSKVWGWLQPGRPGLPYVLLQGKGVAVGRGKEAYEQRLPLLLVGSPPATPTLAGPGSRRYVSLDGLETSTLGAGKRREKASTFIEVADGRISRLHCWIKRGPKGEALLEDCSSNGTFLNGQKVGRSGGVELKDGDRVSLVLSVAPLAEQYFVYHAGDPRCQEPESVTEWIEAASRAWAASPAGSPTAAQLEQHRVASPRRASPAAFKLSRSKTSTYATAEATTLDDLQCQICLGTLRACVALEPCGHNFCATCLSHHFAALLGSGQPLSCPLRCTPPERVVANWAVRKLVSARLAALQQRRIAGSSAATLGARGVAAATAVGAARTYSQALDTLHEAPSGGSSVHGAASMAGESAGTRQEHPHSDTAGAAEAAAADALQGEQAEREQAGQLVDAGLAIAAAPSQTAEAGESPPPSPFAQQPPQGLEGNSDASQHAASPRASDAEGAAGALRGPFAGEDDDDEEGEELGMNPLCPLHDELLPLDASGLKRRQLGFSVEQLQDADSELAVMAALEAIARLGWSDDAVRREIAELGGVESIISCMREYEADDGVQCHGCLALMALVRGEGDVSDANKWKVASNKGVEALVGAMRLHRAQPMVQLSALLAIVPLALENVFLQARIADMALPDILLAMKYHPEEVEVVSKALVALGVLGQGEEGVHEAIRDLIIRRGAPKAIADALRGLGTLSEDVLWACLFALAVIARESSGSYVDHMVGLAAAGVLPALQAAMAAYREDVQEQGLEADEMILKAGDFLVDALDKAEQLLWIRRKRR
ncbi:hypothetical protein N2152v2_009464 [Parachlorella kessleri]